MLSASPPRAEWPGYDTGAYGETTDTGADMAGVEGDNGEDDVVNACGCETEEAE